MSRDPFIPLWGAFAARLTGPDEPGLRDARTSMPDVWPELAPHLPHDGQLRAVFGAQGVN